jgi:osmotically inducible lipoprotein OsmB
MKRMMLGLAALALLSLSSCGNTKQDRALSGAAIGAGAGAGAGALTGGSAVGGALLGGAAGGATGYLTDKDQVNLGKPVWR